MLNPPCLLFRVNKHVKQKGMAAHKQIKTTKMHSSGSTPLQGCNRHHHTRINGLTDSIHPRKATNVTWEKGTILKGNESSEPTINFQRRTLPKGIRLASEMLGGPKTPSFQGVQLGHVGLGKWTLNESMHFFLEEWWCSKPAMLVYQRAM